MIRNIFYIIFLFFIISCAKENDPLQNVLFEDPLIENGAMDVALRSTTIGFLKLQGVHIKYFGKNIKGIYLDTINPPVQFFNDKLLRLENLLPNKTYYWAHVIENISGEVWSDIQSFTTVSFEGSWKLDTMMFAQNYGYGEATTEFLDSMLVHEKDIIEINITDDSAQLKLFKSDDENYINTLFSYDEQNYLLDFHDSLNNTTYSIQIRDAGYLSNYQKVEIISRSKKGYRIFYTRD